MVKGISIGILTRNNIGKGEKIGSWRRFEKKPMTFLAIMPLLAFIERILIFSSVDGIALEKRHYL